MVRCVIVTQTQWTAVDRYISDLFVPSDPALDALPRIEAEQIGPFDFTFIDADKESYPQYLTWAMKLSRPGSVIVADNIVREGQVVDAGSRDTNVQGVRRFNAKLAAETRVVATAFQVVGSKGYDGFAIAVVAGED